GFCRTVGTVELSNVRHACHNRQIGSQANILPDRKVPERPSSHVPPWRFRRATAIPVAASDSFRSAFVITHPGLLAPLIRIAVRKKKSSPGSATSRAREGACNRLGGA